MAWYWWVAIAVIGLWILFQWRGAKIRRETNREDLPGRRFDAVTAIHQIADGTRPGLPEDDCYWLIHFIEHYQQQRLLFEGPATVEGVHAYLDKLRADHGEMPVLQKPDPFDHIGGLYAVKGAAQQFREWLMVNPPQMIGASRQAIEMMQDLGLSGSLAVMQDPSSFQKRIHVAVPRPEEATSLPNHLYAPILHRPLMLAAEAGGNAGPDQLAELGEAVEALYGVRPDRQDFIGLHRAALRYSHSTLEYAQANARYTASIFRGHDKNQVRRQSEEKDRLNADAEIAKQDLHAQIRHLYRNRRDLFDRLAFSDHELVWLDLDDIADEIAGYQ